MCPANAADGAGGSAGGDPNWQSMTPTPLLVVSIAVILLVVLAILVLR